MRSGCATANGPSLATEDRHRLPSLDPLALTSLNPDRAGDPAAATVNFDPTMRDYCADTPPEGLDDFTRTVGPYLSQGAPGLHAPGRLPFVTVPLQMQNAPGSSGGPFVPTVDRGSVFLKGRVPRSLGETAPTSGTRLGARWAA